MWTLVPTLAKLPDFPNSIPACLGRASLSFPWIQSLFPRSEQFLLEWVGNHCLSSLASCFTFCVGTEDSWELQMDSSEATQLSQVLLALQGSLPWESAMQISEQAKISPQILHRCCSSCLLPSLTFCWNAHKQSQAPSGMILPSSFPASRAGNSSFASGNVSQATPNTSLGGAMGTTTPFKVQPSPTVHTKEALGKVWNKVFLPLASVGSSPEMAMEPFLAKGAV